MSDALRPEVLAGGFFYPEGLAWDPSGARIICSGVQDGTVHAVTLDGHSQLLVQLGGGANNVALAAGGGVVVAQNGGIDAHAYLQTAYGGLPPWPQVRPVAPSLQLVESGGHVRDLVSEGLNAPNDVTVRDDGTTWFTDPGNPFLSVRAEPRVLSWSPDRGLREEATGFEYCNGIIADGASVLVTDARGVVRLHDDGTREWAARWGDESAPPDGITLDTGGRIYVAAGRDSGVRVFDDGDLVALLELPGEGMTTNCAFVGPQLDRLAATDARSGSIFVWERIGARGRPPRRAVVTAS